MDPPPPARIGRYRVKRVLGRGGIGVIYHAEDPDIGRSVAIKLVRADLLEGEEREEFLARLKSPIRRGPDIAGGGIFELWSYPDLCRVREEPVVSGRANLPSTTKALPKS